MEPLNKTERNTSLINFIAVYVLILALPLFLSYWMGTKKGGKGGNQKAISEQEALVKDMDALQQYVKDIEEHNQHIPAEGLPFETWNSWLTKAEQQNTEFFKKITDFQAKRNYTGARLRIRDNACAYLFQISKERGNYIQKRRALLGVQNGTAELRRLQNENNQLKSEKQGLQNNLNVMLAQSQKAASAGGGGGAQQPNPQIEELKWQIRFNDANCKKTQADILEAYNENSKRKQLYSVARQNFQIITQNARNNFAIQQLASDKILEIDRLMSRL